jgi:hypothetical protein
LKDPVSRTASKQGGLALPAVAPAAPVCLRHRYTHAGLPGLAFDAGPYGC